MSFSDVQVQVVHPISDEKTRFGTRIIPESILRYYRSNDVRRFSYTKLFVHDDDRDATSDIAVKREKKKNKRFDSI